LLLRVAQATTTHTGTCSGRRGFRPGVSLTLWLPERPAVAGTRIWPKGSCPGVRNGFPAPAAPA